MRSFAHVLIDKLGSRMFNLWPPYLGAGIRVKKMAPDRGIIDVEMRLRFWNKNYVGTQFGGSLYAMCDPFFMFILIKNLGRDYVVWDKAASIRFIKPGRGTVRASFVIPKERIDEIRRQADQERKVEPEFKVSVVDEQGMVVAEVEKLLYVMKRRNRRE